MPDFDIEKLKENEDFKKLLSDSIATATEGLTAKNQELLNEIKTLRKKGDGLSEAELEALREKAKIADDLEKKQLEEKGEYEKLLSKVRDQHTKEVEKLTAQLQGRDTTIHDLLVTGGLTSALSESNVNPALLKAAMKLLADDVQIVEIDGKQVARVGDKTVTDFVKDWAASDVGKNFVLNGNSGGGGSGGGGGGVDKNEKYFDPNNAEYSLTKQAEVYKTDQKAYDSLSAKFKGAVKKTA